LLFFKRWKRGEKVGYNSADTEFFLGNCFSDLVFHLSYMHYAASCMHCVCNFHRVCYLMLRGRMMLHGQYSFASDQLNYFADLKRTSYGVLGKPKVTKVS